MKDVKTGSAGAASDAHGDALKIFISYSRVDVERAEVIVDALQRNGFDVKIDVRDLPYGEEWQTELADFIAQCDTVVWLVSPDSVRSKWCNWELGEVGRLSKRLVPVRVREVAPDTLPESLGRINLLPNRGVYEPQEHEAALVSALNTNRSWIKRATALGDIAREWRLNRKDGAHLLRGRALAEAERWSTSTPRETPPPASEILELILASRRAQQIRRRTFFGVAASVLAVLAGLGWYSQMQARSAREQIAISEATAGQRRNEVARKLFEGENQIGAAIGNLSVVSPDEAATMGQLQGAWSERLTPIRRVLHSTRPQLWMVAGKQVLSVGERLESYDDGMVIAYAAASDDRYVLVDSIGRILVLDGQAGIVESWQWDGFAPAGTYGKPLTQLSQDSEFGGFSRLRLYRIGEGVVLGVGTIQSTYAGGEEPRAILIDTVNGIGALMLMPRPASVEPAGNPTAACPMRAGAASEDIAALNRLYGDKGLTAPFTLETWDAERPAFCVTGRYDDAGALVSTLAEDAFVAPVGRLLSLPVIRPELEFWSREGEARLNRTRWAGAIDTIQPLAGGYNVEFVPEQEFYDKAKFRGTVESGFSYARLALEYHRKGDASMRAPDLKVMRRSGGGYVVAGLFYDKWLRPEVCWFDAAFVVESCFYAGEIYDNGGGMQLSGDGRYLIISGSEMMGFKSVSLVDLDGVRVRSPRQRSGETVLDAYSTSDGQRLIATDNRGVVWSYALPQMDLISTYDLKWPESEEGAFKVGTEYLDFSSRGVVSLLNTDQQTRTWIASPFAAEDAVETASLSSDGRVLLLVSAGGNARVLDTQSGMPITGTFRPTGACRSVEHNIASRVIEISCEDTVLRRTLRPPLSGNQRVNVEQFALDSQSAAQSFFSEVPSFNLGAFASRSDEIVVRRIEGTLQEAVDVNEAQPLDAVTPADVVVPEPAAPEAQLSWPVKGEVTRSFSDAAGQGSIDIAVAAGTEVAAAAAGTVVFAGSGLVEIGPAVLIRHADELISAYGNLGEVLVEVGKTVEAGEIIGRSGLDPASGEAALHFEVRQSVIPVNPLDYLPLP